MPHESCRIILFFESSIRCPQDFQGMEDEVSINHVSMLWDVMRYNDNNSPRSEFMFFLHKHSRNHQKFYLPFFLGETPQNTRRHPGNPTSGSLGSFKCWGPRSWVHHWVAWHLDGLNVWIRLKIWKHLYRCHVWKLGSKWLENGLPSSKTNMTIEISPFPRGNTSSNGGFSIAMFVYRRVQPSYTWGILGWKKPTDPITFDPSTSNGTS